MKLLTVDTICQVCKKPMKIQIEPSPLDKDGNPLVDLEPFLKMACCDNCMVDRHYMKRSEMKDGQVPLPYTDN